MSMDPRWYAVGGSIALFLFTLAFYADDGGTRVVWTLLEFGLIALLGVGVLGCMIWREDSRDKDA